MHGLPGPAHADSLADAALILAPTWRWLPERKNRTQFGSAVPTTGWVESCRSIRVAPTRDQRPQAILMRLHHCVSLQTQSHVFPEARGEPCTERLTLGSEYNAILQRIHQHLRAVDDCRWQVVLWPDAGLMAERWPDIFDQVIEVQHAVHWNSERGTPTLHRWILLGSSTEDRVSALWVRSTGDGLLACSSRSLRPTRMHSAVDVFSHGAKPPRWVRLPTGAASPTSRPARVEASQHPFAGRPPNRMNPPRSAQNALSPGPNTRVYMGGARRGGEASRTWEVDLIFADPQFNWDVPYESWHMAWSVEWAANLIGSMAASTLSLALVGEYSRRHRGRNWGVPQASWTHHDQLVRLHRFMKPRLLVHHGKVHALYFARSDQHLESRHIMELSDRASVYADPRTMAKDQNKGLRLPMDVWYRVQGTFKAATR